MRTPFLSEPEIQERIREHTSARYARLDRLERYVKGTQYDGRPDWFDDSRPLFERAPCLVNTLVRDAIKSHVGLIFKGCPTITTAPDEDESKLDPEYGLDEATSATLDAGIGQIVKHAGLLATWKRLLREAMTQRSAVAVAVVRNGRIGVDVIEAKFCTPTWSKAAPGEAESIEIRYPFVQDEQDPLTLKWGKRVMLFRRVIDAQSDTTFLPVEAPKRRTDPVNWQVDSTKTVRHGLGFCPVRWYKFLSTLGPTHEHDGEAVHDTILDELTAYDFAASQRHRAVLYNGDPIVVEIGVQPGHVPSDTYIGSAMIPTAMPGFPQDNPANAQYRAPGDGTPKRRRGSGSVWQYPKDAKVDYLALPGGVVEALQANVGEIHRGLCDALCWAPIDPKEMQSGATLSGRALELLYTKQVTYCDDVKADFGEGMMLPLLGLLLRVMLAVSRRGEQGGARLAVPGFQKIVEIAERFETKGEDGSAQWITPRMSIRWGDYFAPAETEQKAVAETMAMLVEKRLAKRESAIAALAQSIPSLKIENPAQYAEDMEAEEKAKAEAAAEQQKAMAEHAASLKPQPAPPGQGAPSAAAAPPKPPKPSAKATPAAAPKPPRGPREAKPTPFKKRPQPEA